MDNYKHIEAEIAKKHGAVADATRKAIGDFILDECHPVNVKSNNIAKQNYSPNIISAWRLLTWLKVDAHKLSFIFVDYEIEVTGRVRILEDTGLVPIENLSWECLTIQAQGRGVIQRCKPLKLVPLQSKETFLRGLGDAYREYITRERTKLARVENLLKELGL